MFIINRDGVLFGPGAVVNTAGFLASTSDIKNSDFMAGRKSGPELQICVMQLAREGSPPPGVRLPQTELSRKSNQVARARIRQFESYMPSQAVWSLGGMSGFQDFAQLPVTGRLWEAGGVPRLPDAAKGGSSGDILMVGNLLHATATRQRDRSNRQNRPRARDARKQGGMTQALQRYDAGEPAVARCRLGAQCYAVGEASR
jgi:hypothetical protein